jgi:hypothetical protein
MFVTFLEKESTPQMHVRLPAERMAQEELQKHPHNQPSTPSSSAAAPLPPPPPPPQSTPTSSKFNPFAAPMHASLPLQVPPPGGMPPSDAARSVAPSNSQLLSNPLTSSPMTFLAAPSESSQQSTPASSSAILRDVLKQ